MRGPLNSPVEVGLRAVILLTAAYPRAFDIDTLVLLDHSLIHSGDLGGPPSIHPDVPIRAGEIGLKKTVLEDALRLMMRANMVDLAISTGGMKYVAADNAEAFVSALESSYVLRLIDTAQWVAQEFTDDTHEETRRRLRRILGRWTEELDERPPTTEEVQ
ncbi:ABC-three component system middle component 2 [Micromonospora sp. NPDC047548]|uniref:ABC-three component system middle component 2 n=1 Tax=Micromonospora sp. NPDC047548 TaxID=3155624 RepID=UPI00340EEFC2